MREMILAFAGSLSAGVLFNVKSKNLFWIGLSGMLGWMVFSRLHKTTGGIIIPTFLGAVAVGLFSESMARIIKSPATVFSVSGIFPLVPGIGAYTTVQLIVDNKLAEATSKAVETLASAAAIAMGIMLVFAVFRFASKLAEQN